MLLRGLAGRLEGEVICPGLPGHQGGPDWNLDDDFFEVALAHLLQTLPEEPVDLFGHSLGGVLGLTLAIRHPERIKSLALFEPVLFAAAGPAHVAEHTAEMEPAYAAYQSGAREDATRMFSAMWSGGAPWEALPAPVREQMTAAIDVVFLTRTHLLGDSQGLLAELSSVQVPVLLMTSVEAYPVVHAIEDGLAAQLPKVRVKKLSHPAGHMIPAAAPKLVVPELVQHWS